MKTFPLALALCAGAALCASDIVAQRLTILHTNDTHSQIDPTDKNLGGVLRRKAVIDSVRAAQPNVLLIDAGDMVQGTLYFTLFAGEVESKVMNALGYDLQILGNHEFDNGLESLAKVYRSLDATTLSTNYDVRGTALEGLLKPYVVKEVDGKKVGFIAINLDPAGMIAPDNCEGVVYLDAVKAANATAWHLKHNEGVDRVVALTHIGYTADTGITDPALVAASEDIDLVIGGHSHTLIDPRNPKSVPSRIANANGDSILVAQVGSRGLYVGQIDIDLASGAVSEKLIPVDKRLDDRLDASLAEMLKPYAHGVDSLMNVPVGRTLQAFETENTGLLNLAADMVKGIGEKELGKPVDLAIVNAGGVRSGWTKGVLTKGQIINSFPFDNRVVVLEVKGSDLLEAFDVMASRGGDGIDRDVEAVFDPATSRCVEVLVKGKPVDPDKVYLLATIDYLANGGDYMAPLTRGKRVASSRNVMNADFIEYIQNGPLKGKKLKPDTALRFHPDKK